jgi:hypothetical protein
MCRPEASTIAARATRGQSGPRSDGRLGRDGAPHASGQGLEAPLASGSIRAATDRRRDEHDRCRIVVDRRRAQALTRALICAFLMIPHDLWNMRRTDRVARVGSDTEEDGGSTPPAPTIPAVSRAFVDQRALLADRIGGEAGSSGQRALPCLTKGGLSAGQKHVGRHQARAPPAQMSTQGPAPPPGRDAWAGTAVIRALAVYSWSGRPGRPDMSMGCRPTPGANRRRGPDHPTALHAAPGRLVDLGWHRDLRPIERFPGRTAARHARESPDGRGGGAHRIQRNPRDARACPRPRGAAARRRTRLADHVSDLRPRTTHHRNQVMRSWWPTARAWLA